MFRVIAFFCLLATSAFAIDDRVAVSREDASTLKELIKRLHVVSKGMAPIQDILWSPGGISDVVERILKSPPVAESGTPLVFRYDLKGFFVVGKVDSQDSSAASRSHQAECDSLASYLSATLAPYFDSFSCGSTSNVSQYASIGYKQFGSIPTATLKFGASIKVKPVEGDQIDDTLDDKDSHEAYASWLFACKKWMEAEKTEAAEKFLGASCGLPQNMSKFGSQGYKRFVSRGTLVLKD